MKVYFGKRRSVNLYKRHTFCYDYHIANTAKISRDGAKGKSIIMIEDNTHDK